MSKQEEKPASPVANRVVRRSENTEAPPRNYTRLYIKTRKIQYFFTVSDADEEWTPNSSRRKKMKKISKSSSSKKGKKRNGGGKLDKHGKKKRLFQVKGQNKDAEKV